MDESFRLCFNPIQPEEAADRRWAKSEATRKPSSRFAEQPVRNEFAADHHFLVQEKPKCAATVNAFEKAEQLGVKQILDLESGIAGVGLILKFRNFAN